MLNGEELAQSRSLRNLFDIYDSKDGAFKGNNAKECAQLSGALEYT